MEYFLGSDEFATLNAPELIRKRAHELLELINGSMQARRSDFAAVEIEEVVGPDGAGLTFGWGSNPVSEPAESHDLALCVDDADRIARNEERRVSQRVGNLVDGVFQHRIPQRKDEGVNSL